ncbi:probable dual specificity tyrosine-phosphorylation-regulated kinase at C-terminar half [Coccomyxa sp. Obi]|nr:probable dual specificity tyrosine-phosphorylation-regulated kinase at C-terminar half [Coccomyxa sp. Obi]
MDSPSRHSETLNFIVHFLHTNGLYAAEEALVRELENRYPEIEGSSPVSQPEGDDGQEDTFAFTSSIVKTPGEVPTETGAGGPTRAESTTEPPTSPGVVTAPTESESGAPQDGAVHGPGPVEDSDEYEDDDDPGYVREDIRCQDAFVARELDMSDEDGSTRGVDVYHRALASQGQQWGEDGGDSSSSDGRGSSYFSGERVERDKSSSASPLALDAPAATVQQGGARTVVIAEPVYPADSPARSAMSASAVASPALGTAAALKLQPARAASSGEVASRRKASKREASRAEETAATSQAAAIAAVAASSGATYLDDAARKANSHEAPPPATSAAEVKGTVLGGTSAGRSFLGVFEKVSDVFSRRVQPRSDSESSKISTQEAASSEVLSTPSAAPQKEAEAAAEPVMVLEQETSAPDAEETSNRFAALTIKPGREVSIDAENVPTKGDMKTPTFGFSAVKTAEPASPSGRSEEDEAFSFPVTPPSEPAAPGAVFSSWHSFRKRRPSKGTASSGYDSDDDLSMSRASDSFSAELSPELQVGGSCSSPDVQSAPRNAPADCANSPSVSDAANPSSSSPRTHQQLLTEQAATSSSPESKPQSAASDCQKQHIEPDTRPCELQPPRLHKEISLAQHLMAAALPPEGEAGRQPPLDPVPEGSDAPPFSSSAPFLPLDSAEDGGLTSQSSLAHLAAAGAAGDNPAENWSAPEASTPEPEFHAALPKVASVDLMPRSGRLFDSMQGPAAGREAPADEPPLRRATGRAAAPAVDGAAAQAVPSRLSMVSRAAEVVAGKDASSASAEQPVSLPAKMESRGEEPVPPPLLPDGPAAHSAADDSAQTVPGPLNQSAGQHQLAFRPLDVSASLPQRDLVDLHTSAMQSSDLAQSPDSSPFQGPPDAVPDGIPSRAKRGASRQQALSDAAAGSSPASIDARRAVVSSPVAADADASNAAVVFEYDPEYIERKYEIMTLRVIHRRRRTGFEETKDFPIRVNDLIAGRYQVMDFLGSAAFSKAVQALDVKTGRLVCLKIIKNNKDYFDQSLDEIKLLSYINAADPADEHGLLRLYDYFYYKEHLFLVCELLRANLYEFQKYNRESGDAPYFILPRVQSIARQVLRSLAFLHSLGLIHSDLKPENILIKSYSRCEVKVIDFGSSCFTTDQLSSYVQSRSYRAPEVILGLPYGQKVDVWSLGCILAELLSGFVLFQNDSLATLLARLEGILGPVPRALMREGRYSQRYYTRSGALFDRNPRTHRYEYLHPKRTSLRKRVPEADQGCLDFLAFLLTVDPDKRPSAEEALQHPWLQCSYPPIPTE